LCEGQIRRIRAIRQIRFFHTSTSFRQHQTPTIQEITVSNTKIQTEKAPAAIGPYSQGIVAGGFLFTAGQIALDPATGLVVPGDVVPQTERVLANLQGLLEAAGATWSEVVKTTVFLQDMADFPRMNEVYARYLGKEAPARSTVQAAGLPRGARVEIDLIAAF
jgi:2-iminobutanoate/2-iminopropanoate deaminase